MRKQAKPGEPVWGGTIWDAALLLSAYLSVTWCQRPQRTLELGSGTGLVGLVASRLGAKVRCPFSRKNWLELPGPIPPTQKTDAPLSKTYHFMEKVEVNRCFCVFFFSMWVVSSGRWPSPTFLACCLYWRCGGQAAKWLGEILEAPRHIKIIEVFWSGTVELHLTSFKFRLFFLRRFWTSNQNSIFYHLLIFPPSKHPAKNGSVSHSSFPTGQCQGEPCRCGNTAIGVARRRQQLDFCRTFLWLGVDVWCAVVWRFVVFFFLSCFFCWKKCW